MITIQEIQSRFKQTMLHETDVDILPLVKGTDDASVKRRLSIYRNNIFYSLTEAMADLYPVVKRLVGTEFFNAMTAEYLRIHPPGQAAMIFLGADFPEFLAGFEPVTELVYLPDIARLELAYHQAYHAEDAGTPGIGYFSDFDTDTLAQATINLHPSIRMVISEFPIVSIWQANHPGSAGEDIIDLEIGGETALVFRPRFQVKVKKITDEMSEFLHQLQQGKTVGETINSIAEMYPGSDISLSLSHSIKSGYFHRVNL